MQVLEATFKISPVIQCPKTLEDSCIEKAIDLFIKWNSCPIRGEEFIEVVQRIMEPFFSYPQWLIEYIFQSITAFVENQKLRIELVEIFLKFQPKNLTLCLGKIPKSQWANTINMTLPILNGLEKMTFRFTEFASAESYDSVLDLARECHLCGHLQDFCSQITNIVYLDVGGLCYFELFDTIALNCPNLTFLRGISNSITDDILLCLAMNTKDPSDSRPRCQKLKEIEAPFGTENISSHCIMLLLQILPNLSVLDGFDVSNALIELHRFDYMTTNKKYALQTCNISHCDYYLLSKIIPRVCPYFKELLVSLPTRKDLVNFSKFSHLRHISIIFPTYPVNLFDDFVPVLQNNGKIISILHLINIYKIDFFVVSYFCPNLEAFGAYYFRQVTESRLPANGFRNLESLAILPFQGTSIPIGSLRLLFNNSVSLNFLSLKNIKFPNDLSYEIMQRNPFNHLKNLTLSNVEDISYSAIELFAKRCSARFQKIEVETEDEELYHRLHALMSVQIQP